MARYNDTLENRGTLLVYGIRREVQQAVIRHFADAILVQNDKDPEILWQKQLTSAPLSTKLYASDVMHDYLTDTVVICLTDKSYVLHKLANYGNSKETS